VGYGERGAVVAEMESRRPCDTDSSLLHEIVGGRSSQVVPTMIIYVCNYMLLQ
jgi:hypothetical protein